MASPVATGLIGVNTEHADFIRCHYWEWCIFNEWLVGGSVRRSVWDDTPEWMAELSNGQFHQMLAQLLKSSSCCLLLTVRSPACLPHFLDLATPLCQTIQRKTVSMPLLEMLPRLHDHPVIFLGVYEQCYWYFTQLQLWITGSLATAAQACQMTIHTGCSHAVLRILL